MIQHLFRLVVGQLDNYINGIAEGDGPFAVAGNIGLARVLGGDDAFLDNKIVVSLVNVMEETTLKNGSPYRSSSLNPELENPPIYLNLFLLFTANFSAAGAPANNDHNYYNGLTRLAQVIEFFQGQQVFSVSNAPTAGLVPDAVPLDPALMDMQQVVVKMELFTLTFEQTNYLWGALGGKQLPFVLYKAHVLPITRRNLTGRGAPIQDIQTTSVNLSTPES